ncbi:MAG TPA: hypothetical protein VMZ25_05510 [Terriglobales bacterium]|nr:hypothetical protein [Terriglobales bacterium]
MKTSIQKNLAPLGTMLAGTLLLLASLQPQPALAGRHDRDYKLQETEIIKNSYPVAGALDQRSIEVDNVFGSVEVVGTSGDQIQLVVNKTIYAESAEKVVLAKKEVTLDVKQDGDILKFFVNGPFRCNCDGGCNNWGREPGYSVKMDFQLQVPNRMKFKLKTVNDGNIKVQGVAGDFQVRNVNGSISMSDVAGSGSAVTVNGPVTVRFRSNPKEDSEFKSINGNVELHFAKDLSADFRFKTFNGGVYTDFPMTGLPQKQPAAEKKNGRFVYRSDRFTGGRVGSGGPEIKIENLNGDIKVLERHV